MSETPNFKDLDTAALVAVGKKLAKRLENARWWRDELVISAKRHGNLTLDQDDAAFVQAIPDLVRELVARLQQHQTSDEITLTGGDTLNIQYRTDGEHIDPDSVVISKEPKK